MPKTTIWALSYLTSPDGASANFGVSATFFSSFGATFFSSFGATFGSSFGAAASIFFSTYALRASFMDLEAAAVADDGVAPPFFLSFFF